MKFKIGDYIKIKENSKSEFMPGEIGTIRSFWYIETEDQVNIFNFPLHSELYSIELITGPDILVPEADIELFFGRKRKFDFGEEMKIVDYAPLEYHPGEIGSIFDVCFHKVDDKFDVNSFPNGDFVYSLELLDGTSIDVPELFLVGSG